MNKKETLELWTSAQEARQAAKAEGRDDDAIQAAAAAVWNQWVHELIEERARFDVVALGSGRNTLPLPLALLAGQRKAEADGTQAVARLLDDYLGEYQDWLRQAQVDFSDHAFDDDADFSDFLFPGTTNFSGCHFHGCAWFARCQFDDNAYFHDAVFRGQAVFLDTHFMNSAEFDQATMLTSVILSSPSSAP